MLEHTTIKDILAGQKIIETVANKLKINILYTCCLNKFSKQLKVNNKIFVMDRYLLPWK